MLFLVIGLVYHCYVSTWISDAVTYICGLLHGQQPTLQHYNITTWQWYSDTVIHHYIVTTFNHYSNLQLVLKLLKLYIMTLKADLYNISQPPKIGTKKVWHTAYNRKTISRLYGHILTYDQWYYNIVQSRVALSGATSLWVRPCTMRAMHPLHVVKRYAAVGKTLQ